MTAANAEGLALAGRRERLALLGLASPALLVVLLIMVLPVGWLFYLSFIGSEGQFSLENYQRMLDEYGDLWHGVGELFAHRDDLTNLTFGETARADHPFEYPVDPR